MRKTINVAFLFKLFAVAAILAVVVHFIHWVQTGKQVRALAHQADGAERRGELARAEQYLRRLLALRPADADSRVRLVLLMESSARTDEGHRQVYLEMEQVLKDAPNRDDIRRREITMLLDHPRLRLFAEANAHVDHLLATDPDDARLHEQKGQCMMMLGDFDAAALAWAKAVEFSPDLVSAYGRSAGVMRYRLGQPDKADALIRVMLARNNASAPAHLIAAYYWKDLGNTEQFAREIDEARRCNPKATDVVLAVAELARLRADKLAKSKDDAGSSRVIEEACVSLRQAIDDSIAHLAEPATSAGRDEQSQLRLVLGNLFVSLVALETQANRHA